MDTKAESLNRLKLPDVGSEFVQCPNCRQQIKHQQLSQHCEEEMDRLQGLQSVETSTLKDKNNVSTTTKTNDIEDRKKPYTVFQKVQRNRYSRLKQRTRKRALSNASSTPERACPVCNKSFSQDDIEHHVEDCLRRSKITNGQNGHPSSDSDEGGDEYEEYEWAGQKRIRVSSMLQGGYAAIGIGQTITNSNTTSLQERDGQTDEDEDLNVDEDDTHIYGPPQYGESDIISPKTECVDGNNEEDVTHYMRKLITSGIKHNDEREKSEKSNQEFTNNKETSEATTSNSVFNKKSLKSEKSVVYEQIIDSLKDKLRIYESQQQSKYKCLICLDDYRKPAISVSCWHVHCEDCWLRSLGARKLCPQCNLITTPKDLRRIYM